MTSTDSLKMAKLSPLNSFSASAARRFKAAISELTDGQLAAEIKAAPKLTERRHLLCQESSKRAWVRFVEVDDIRRAIREGRPVD